MGGKGGVNGGRGEVSDGLASRPVGNRNIPSCLQKPCQIVID